MNHSTHATQSQKMPAKLYITSDTKHIILPPGEAMELKTLPQMDYSDITIEIMDTDAQLLLSSPAIAAAAEIILPDNATLNYAFNSQTGLVEISNASNQVIVTLPIDGDGRTLSTLQMDNSADEFQLQVDINDFSVTAVEPGSPVEPPVHDYDVPHPGVQLNGLDIDWVDDTSISPYSAVGYIEATHEEMGNQYITGSGVMISPKHVLTNSHVVMENSNLADQISFYAGLNGENTATYSFAEAVYVYAQSDTESASYPPEMWPDNDIAIITLEQPIGDQYGYYSLYSTTEDQLTTQEVFWAGYPQDNIIQDDPSTYWEDIYQWQAFGEIFDYSDTGYYDPSTGHSFDGGDGQLWFTETMAGTGGASGSPVFYQNGDELTVVGVYSGSHGDVPVAANIDADSYQWISNILAADGYTIA